MNHILLSFKAHSSWFLQINESSAYFRWPAERVNFCSISNTAATFLASCLEGWARSCPCWSPGAMCAWVVFLSPGRQPSKPAMCACEMPLCIFRKFLRGRQPKYFYCTAGTVSCWSVGKKKKKKERKGGEDLKLAHRLKWLMASRAWSTIPLSWEHYVTVSFPPNVPTQIPVTIQRRHSPQRVNLDDQVGLKGKRTQGRAHQPRQGESKAPWGVRHVENHKEWGGKGKVGQPSKQALGYGHCPWTEEF